ncbi:cysteine hydrolase family protein [Trichloromonas sp.]|uniref:cysteine hydrolase family protein n=1 Tax=Trichloromonas sp. TaxID=3069249 RepID=UPI002A3D3E80|nr:isochorismatase family cysteine hydrolase [Trichloromonas sp.]
MNQALLVIDMLNDFVREGAVLEVPETRTILPALRARLAEARRTGVPVLFLCDAHASDDREFSRMGWPPHALRGSVGARVIDELAPRPEERIVEKTSYSGFAGTALDGILKELGVTDLVLTGCVTNICVLYTAADAVMRGYRVTVPVDAVAALDEADGAFALRQMEQVLGVRVLR